MEEGSVTIRRAWIPVNGLAQFSEPKSRRSRRTIALDAVTLEALRGARGPPGRRTVRLARRTRRARPGLHPARRPPSGTLDR